MGDGSKWENGCRDEDENLWHSKKIQNLSIFEADDVDDDHKEEQKSNSCGTLKIHKIQICIKTFLRDEKCQSNLMFPGELQTQGSMRSSMNKSTTFD